MIYFTLPLILTFTVFTTDNPAFAVPKVAPAHHSQVQSGRMPRF